MIGSIQQEFHLHDSTKTFIKFSNSKVQGCTVRSGSLSEENVRGRKTLQTVKENKYAYANVA